MPNAKTHFVAGVVTAGVVNGLAQWAECLHFPERTLDWGEFFICCFAGGAVALLPDVLEPAEHPNHRQFFHSVAAAGLVAFAVSGRHTEGYSPQVRKLLCVLGCSYLSHVLLDSDTPKGIRFI